MYDVLRFWLERGADGFRVDALRQLVKDEQLRDNPPNPDPNLRSPYDALLPVYSTDRPETHQPIREMRAVLEEYGDRLLIGDLYLPIERLPPHYREDHVCLQLHLLVALPSTSQQALGVSAAHEPARDALAQGPLPHLGRG